MFKIIINFYQITQWDLSHQAPQNISAMLVEVWPQQPCGDTVQEIAVNIISVIAKKQHAT